MGKGIVYMLYVKRKGILKMKNNILFLIKHDK